MKVDYKSLITTIADYDESGDTLARWAKQKLDEFNQFVGHNRDALIENGGAAMLAADIIDFYLRVIEDRAAYGKDFRSGDDDRIQYYLSIGAAVVDAPNDEIGRKILGCEK